MQKLYCQRQWNTKNSGVFHAANRAKHAPVAKRWWANRRLQVCSQALHPGLQLATGNGTSDAPVVKGSNYVTPQGQLGSVVNRGGPLCPSDVYKCPGCRIPDCQGPQGCAKMPWRHAPGGYMKEILIAKHRIYDVAVETPLHEAHILSQQLGNKILLKREDMQQVRGAFNRMSRMSQEERDRGVICASAGNHAQGVAVSANKLGCKALICMPVTVQEIKLNAVKRLGAEIELVGETLQESTVYAQAKAEAEGRTFIPPFDDPYIIAGQGTVGEEIMRQCADWENLYAVFVPVGGGGLIAGIAAYIKELHPEIKMIGVEPYGCNSMAASLSVGRRVQLDKVDTFADGVALKKVGAEPYRLCRDLLDGVVQVSNAAVAAAIGDVCTEKRSILEPAGALALAGAKAYLERHNLKGNTVVAVLTGANMSIQRLAMVSEMADLGARREAMLITTLSEQRGGLSLFYNTASAAQPDLLFTEMKYRFSGPEAQLLWSVAVAEESDLEQLVKRLNEAGMRTLDISDLEVAQLHLRSMGGRPQCVSPLQDQDLSDEVIMQVEVPERPGAVGDVIRAVSADGQLNVTLYHYRRSGGVSTKTLLGVQIPAALQYLFDEGIKGLGKGFHISRLSGKALDVFQMLNV